MDYLISDGATLTYALLIYPYFWISKLANMWYAQDKKLAMWLWDG